jgi:hypothetical protein
MFTKGEARDSSPWRLGFKSTIAVISNITETLLCGRHYIKYFSCISAVNPIKNSEVHL